MVSNTARSRKQELKGAERIGGRRVSGSGSGWATKNDIKNDLVSVEMKYTDKKSFSLRVADLVKAERQALMDSGREFAFMVEFSTAGRTYVIVSQEFAEGQGLLRGNPE